MDEADRTGSGICLASPSASISEPNSVSYEAKPESTCNRKEECVPPSFNASHVTAVERGKDEAAKTPDRSRHEADNDKADGAQDPLPSSKHGLDSVPCKLKTPPQYRQRKLETASQQEQESPHATQTEPSGTGSSSREGGVRGGPDPDTGYTEGAKASSEASPQCDRDSQHGQRMYGRQDTTNSTASSGSSASNRSLSLSLQWNDGCPNVSYNIEGPLSEETIRESSKDATTLLQSVADMTVRSRESAAAISASKNYKEANTFNDYPMNNLSNKDFNYKQ